MKKKVDKSKGVVKGAPSGFVISLAVHAVAFLLAGMFVVFTVVNKEEKKFVPPKPVERPKMKLKKPKVKVKKSAKPKQTNRIVTRVKRASMPDIQLPEMSGLSGSIGGDIGGFELLPELEELTIFGSGQTIGSDLEGTFYDLKRNRQGRPVPMDPDNFSNIMANFVRRDWRKSLLSQYYRSPKKLYATAVAVPPLQSAAAPEAFGEGETLGYCWSVHYEGQLVYPEDITFRFWGMGDDLLVVRVDKKIVLIANWPNGTIEASMAPLWSSTSADTRKYPLGNNASVVGDWITLKAGEALDMEILLGESPGGIFAALLCVEVEGVEYERNPYQNGPRLPIFKTAKPTLDLVDVIHFDLNEGEASVREGPIFNDLGSRENNTVAVEPSIEAAEPKVTQVEESKLRSWNMGGKIIEAEFITKLGQQLILKNAKGKQSKVQLSEISDEDRRYVELADPPEFKINFNKSSAQQPPPPQTPFLNEDQRHIRIFDMKFGAQVQQKTPIDYNYPVTVEYFAIGEEITGEHFKLLERNQETFVPSKENQRALIFSGEEVRIKEYATRQTGNPRGIAYSGYLVTVTDETGTIIQHAASNEFLFEHLENLKSLPVGKFFNKECIRVTPSRPDKSNYF